MEAFNRINELKERVAVKSKVVDAAIYAIQEADVLHKIGSGTVKIAIESVKREVEEYVSTGPEVLADVRNIAQDAAEDVFRSLGFDSAELLKDFNETLNERLGLPALSE